MPKKESPHCVVQMGGRRPVIQCLHCGAKIGMQLPCRVDDYCDSARKFEARHRDCPKPGHEEAS